jgi:predicted amidophosphoribosyltransferase
MTPKLDPDNPRSLSNNYVTSVSEDRARRLNKASLNQSEPMLLKPWNIRNRSILFVDDCITSGTTARLCYEILVDLGNHVDGLIWMAT